MEISEIKPILTADKATLTFSAEKDGKIRVTYEWDDAKAVPFGYRFEVV